MPGRTEHPADTPGDQPARGIAPLPVGRLTIPLALSFAKEPSELTPPFLGAPSGPWGTPEVRQRNREEGFSASDHLAAGRDSGSPVGRRFPYLSPAARISKPLAVFPGNGQTHAPPRSVSPKGLAWGGSGEPSSDPLGGWFPSFGGGKGTQTRNPAGDTRSVSSAPLPDCLASGTRSTERGGSGNLRDRMPGPSRGDEVFQSLPGHLRGAWRTLKDLKSSHPRQKQNMLDVTFHTLPIMFWKMARPDPG